MNGQPGIRGALWLLAAGFAAGIAGSLALPLLLDAMLAEGAGSPSRAWLVNASFLVAPAIGAAAAPRSNLARGLLAGTTALCAFLLLPSAFALTPAGSPISTAAVITGIACLAACWLVLRGRRWADMAAFVLVVFSLFILTNLSTPRP